MKKVLHFFLFIALLAFALDLFHMLYHLAEAPALWQLAGVPTKLAIKIFFVLIPLSLLLARRFWLGGISLFLFLAFITHPTSGFAADAHACRHARELLTKSGMAREAKEDLLGQLKLSPPYGSFPSDMDKIAWWGTFQPFEFWEGPEFQAVWIRPDGQEAAKQKFRPGKCKLAATSVRGETQPRGEFQGGMWNVVVTCEDYLIDKQNFAVLPSGGPSRVGPDVPKKNQESAMIWAKDAVKN